MNIVQIEANLQKLINFFSKETFIYDLFLAYGLPKASITRLQKDIGFKDDTAKVNVKQLFKQLSPETELKVI